MTQFDARNVSMVMDFYELTMAEGYFKSGDQPRVAFDVFYRKVPSGGGFAIFAGLEQIIEYVENFRFEDSDVAYLRSLNLFSEDFLDYLRKFRFRGDIYAFAEGTIIYPQEPFMTVVASPIDAQLIETAILSQINHQSLIATKARRIVKAADGRSVFDFGARRAHNFDAAVYGARAAYIGGHSDPRNETMMKMFSLINVGERAGGGIPDMVRKWTKVGYERPILSEEVDPERSTIVLPLRKTKAAEDGRTEKAQLQGHRQVHLTKNQQMALDLAQSQGRVTTAILAQEAGISKQTASRTLKYLSDSELLSWHGTSKRDPSQYYDTPTLAWE